MTQRFDWPLNFDRPDPVEPWPTQAAWAEHIHRRAVEVRATGKTALILPKPWWMPKRLWYWSINQVLIIVDPDEAAQCPTLAASPTWPPLCRVLYWVTRPFHRFFPDR